MSSIVVLKSAASVLGSKGEDPAAMALTEVQRAHDAAWNCPAVDGGSLQFKLSEEVIRRSAEWRRTFNAQNEKENMNVEDVGEEGEEEEEEEEEDDEEMDEQGLRNRVWALEEDKGRLHKDLAAMTLKETILRDKVREFEMQMDAHRKRVERAERTILELRQAAAQSTKQARQSEKDTEEMRLSDGEKADLQARVERLQQLCLDHEKSIHGLRQGLKNGTDGNKEGRMSRLQKELQRLSGVEITLRTDLEASRVENSTLRRDINCLLERFANQQREGKLQMNKLEQELRGEIDRGQARVAELQDDNSVLFAKLRLLTRERQDSREALRCCNNQVAELEDENRILQEQVAKVEKAVEAKQMEVEQLESHLERSRQNQEIAQTALALKDKATLNEKEPFEKIAPQLGAEMRQSLQAAAQQLYSMNERLEKLMDKLSERDLQLQEARAEVAGKDEVITGLEHTLSNLAKTVDSQSARLMRISKQNEDLTRGTQLQARQIDEFQARIAAAVESKSKAEQELAAARKRLEDYSKDYESQGLTCQLLQERVDGLEAELHQCHPQITSLRHEREELEVERENLHHSLADVTLRVTDLEHRLADREQVVKLQEEALEDLRKVVEEGRKELSLVKQERDEMQKEAEAMSREALRTSVEVEVLRRRVRQLDEDVLLRDGQICILRGGLEDS